MERIKPEKIKASTAFEPVTSAIPGAMLYQLSCEATHWERGQCIEGIFNLAHSVWCINLNWHILFSDSSLEVLLQHLSLQDVDARDNEVCRLLTYKWTGYREYIRTAKKDAMYEDLIDHGSYAQNVSVVRFNPGKQFRVKQDLNPWPSQYWCSALLPTELSSQLGDGHIKNE